LRSITFNHAALVISLFDGVTVSPHRNQ
jgi:hypothetical protein